MASDGNSGSEDERPAKKIKRTAGLEECQEMDQQSAAIASANWSDITGVVQEDVFQHVGFLGLLGMRRVCKNWKLAISRESAPFLRNVAIDMEQWHLEFPRDRNYWQFAKGATSVLMYAKSTYKVDGSASKRVGIVWDEYKKQALADKRRVLIKKVFYVNVVLESEYLRHSAVNRAGFRTVVHKVTMRLDPQDLFHFDYDSGYDFDLESELRLEVDVWETDSYELTRADVAAIKKPEEGVDGFWLYFNPAGMYFARRHVKRLDEDGAEWLERSLRDVRSRSNSSEDALNNLVEQMVKSFDAGNETALDHFRKKNLGAFVAAVHPLVPALLLRFFGDEDDQGDMDGDCSIM